VFVSYRLRLEAQRQRHADALAGLLESNR